MKNRTTSRRTSVRRSSIPRAKGTGFGAMLAKLGLASSQLQSARSRRR